MARKPEATDFLYPFIEREERDPGPLMADLARSAQAKWAQSAALRARTIEECDAQLRTVAAAMAERFAAGGQAFTFGNGGSATDADAFAQLCTRPPWGQQLPVRSLAFDQAVLTALSNDIGFDVVFSRQLEAYGRRGDIAIGFSTSGNSDNLLAGFAQARKRGMLTVGLAGYDGGRMGASEDVEHCLVVRSDSVHRVQESQAAVAHVLWAFVQSALGTAEQLTDPDQKVAS
ncbi:MAG TPA: SIS domain-containing protein [Acidimicrobiales bacterium]|nr:SIS domain-containing protein [Acidimicrobiales bacterium]